jgi:phosphoenolpyruvate synthase/pyruvate phosphate dikinase
MDLTTATAEDVVRVGAKAANFAEIMSIVPEVRMPRPAFAIPFAAFDKHMTDHGLWTELEGIVADAPTGTELEERLFALRLRLYRAPMDPATVAAIQSMVETTFGADEVRFRSSTNVEDLPSFSGAGLYTSVGGYATEVESKVKVVWASAFNYAAFVEREFYRVDHRQVMMGVLVHRSFEEEMANGVALTINEFTALRPGFYINSQKGEVSVTNPTGEATPEQILWYRYYQGLPEYYEVLTRSSLTGGEPVLGDAQYSELAQLLELVHARFRILYCGLPEGGYDPNCATDVEWKVAADGLLYIKQARPLRGAQARQP